MITEPVAISLISAGSGIAIAYVVNVTAKRVQQVRDDKQPKDRMEQMFDGYERLIRQKDREDERKAGLINELKEEIMLTQKMVADLQNALSRSQDELEQSKDDNDELRGMLKMMREEYRELRNAEKEKNNVI